MLLMLMTLSAQAAGLDLLEVGGAWGTPGATNPTAIWWNPAGLAVGGGTQFIIEGAPTFAKVYGDRANPDYGTIEEDTGKGELFEGAPRDYDYSGRDEVSLTAVVPFIGVQTDFGVEGLGIGAGLAVPTATGGEIEDPWGANRYSLRSGNIQAPQLILAGSYRIKEIISLGASFNVIESGWASVVDTSTYPDLAFAVQEELNLDHPPNSFRDGYSEHPGYATTADFVEHVVLPIAEVLDPDGAFAIEVVNEPECLTDEVHPGVGLPWATVVRGIATIREALNQALPGVPVTSGTQAVFLPGLFAGVAAGEPAPVDAVDLHVYHPNGGLPARQDLPVDIGDLPLFAGEAGAHHDSPDSAHLVNYLYNGPKLGYQAVFLWQLEGEQGLLTGQADRGDGWDGFVETQLGADVKQLLWSR